MERLCRRGQRSGGYRSVRNRRPGATQFPPSICVPHRCIRGAPPPSTAATNISIVFAIAGLANRRSWSMLRRGTSEPSSKRADHSWCCSLDQDSIRRCTGSSSSRPAAQVHKQATDESALWSGAACAIRVLRVAFTKRAGAVGRTKGAARIDRRSSSLPDPWRPKGPLTSRVLYVDMVRGRVPAF